jgi:hypothetical protein
MIEEWFNIQTVARVKQLQLFVLGKAFEPTEEPKHGRGLRQYTVCQHLYDP